jgi:hypothetical protein
VRPVIADFRRNREIRRSVNSQFADLDEAAAAAMALVAGAVR